MYAISIAATLLTLAGLELLSLIFKSIGMKSSVITFSTSSKEILPQVSRRFNSKDYLVVSYNLDRQVQGEYTNYQVTMVIKSKKGYDEGYLLQLMQWRKSNKGNHCCFSVRYFQYRTGMSCLCFRGLRRSLMQIALK